MSGSEFERENIVAEALSATAASKPADTLLEDTPREHSWRPPAEGMYDLSMEKDSCGVGFIANIKGKKSHQIVSDAISILCNLEHRGAVGADPRAGDGAGILVQIPHAFFSRKDRSPRLQAAAARRTTRSARCSCRRRRRGAR
jgi:glutamate synthase (NADPH/NADH) large chain